MSIKAFFFKVRISVIFTQKMQGCVLIITAGIDLVLLCKP